MVFLEGLDRKRLGLEGLEGAEGGLGGGEGGHDRDALVEGGGADLDFILAGDGAGRRVDDEGDVAVLEHVEDVGATLGELEEAFDGDAGLLERGGSAAGAVDPEAEGLEAAGLQGGDYSSAELKQWLDRHHAAPTDYFRDPDGRVGHLYDAKTTPHMFIIDPKGTLMYDGAIDSISSARQSDIPRATNYVREALAEMKAGKPVTHAATRPYGCSVKYGTKG